MKKIFCIRVIIFLLKIHDQVTIFYSAFDKVNADSHAGLYIAQYNLNHYYFIPFRRKWLYNFNEYSIDCQVTRHVNMKQPKGAISPCQIEII